MARDCRYCRFNIGGDCSEGLPWVKGVDCPSFRRCRVGSEGSLNYKKRQQATLERAGWKCEYCGDTLTSDNYTIDHRIPLSNGGSRLKQRNLKAACRPCNETKGNMSEAHFMRVISSEEPPPKFARELFAAWQRAQSHASKAV